MIGIQKETWTVVLDREHIDLLVRDLGLDTVQKFGFAAKQIAKWKDYPDGDWQLGVSKPEEVDYLLSFLTCECYEVVKVGGHE